MGDLGFGHIARATAGFTKCSSLVFGASSRSSDEGDFGVSEESAQVYRVVELNEVPSQVYADRFFVKLSDGNQVILGILAKDLNDLVLSKMMCENVSIWILQACRERILGRDVIFVLDLRVIPYSDVNPGEQVFKNGDDDPRGKAQLCEIPVVPPGLQASFSLSLPETKVEDGLKVPECYAPVLSCLEAGSLVPVSASLLLSDDFKVFKRGFGADSMVVLNFVDLRCVTPCGDRKLVMKEDGSNLQFIGLSVSIFYVLVPMLDVGDCGAKCCLLVGVLIEGSLGRMKIVERIPVLNLHVEGWLLLWNILGCPWIIWLGEFVEEVKAPHWMVELAWESWQDSFPFWEFPWIWGSIFSFVADLPGSGGYGIVSAFGGLRSLFSKLRGLGAFHRFVSEILLDYVVVALYLGKFWRWVSISRYRPFLLH